jgi:hypothetical protein
MNRKTIALISPNQNAYSETFIQAHKKYLDANIKFYYNGFLPTSIENGEPLVATKGEFYLWKILNKLHKRERLTFQEDILKKSFKNEKIEKVYAEYGPTAVAVLNLCKTMKLPLIVNFHGFDISVKSIIDKYEREYKDVFEYAESIVAVSKHMRSKLIQLGAIPEKIVHTPCAPDDVFFKINPKFSEKAFVAVGRFVFKLLKRLFL